MSADAATDQPAIELRCDTCGKPSARLSRVVIDEGYNRADARPIWNCPECYERKNQERRQRESGQSSAP
ncbi:MAG TPA: hypothetical protein VGC20_05755 [bacterium]